MEEEKKKLLFISYFQHISLCFYSNFNRESSLDVELNSLSNEYPLGILLTGTSNPKIINAWKNVMMTSSSCFFRYFFFWGVVGSIKSMSSGYSLDVEFNSTSNDYLLSILSMCPTTPKTRNTWKNVMIMSSSCFFKYFLFWG